MRRIFFMVALVLVAAVSCGVGAQELGSGIPVDIPGTGVNFFLYRFTGEEKPFHEVNAIWANLSKAFEQWVLAGQNPKDLTGEDVQVVVNPTGSVSLYLKDQFIVEVDEYHAKINRATPKQLAEKWAANLREGVERFVSINELKE